MGEEELPEENDDVEVTWNNVQGGVGGVVVMVVVVVVI